MDSMEVVVVMMLLVMMKSFRLNFNRKKRFSGWGESWFAGFVVRLVSFQLPKAKLPSFTQFFIIFGFGTTFLLLQVIIY